MSMLFRLESSASFRRRFGGLRMRPLKEESHGEAGLPVKLP